MIFGIIWIIVIISIISKAIKTAGRSQNRNLQTRSGQMSMDQMHSNASEAPSSPAAGSRPTFRSVPGSTYGTTRNVQQNQTTAQRNSGYGQGAFAPASYGGKVRSSSRKDTLSGSMFGARHAGSLGENSVLLEDRRNDWLAKQLREEAAIKRRGSIYDLGAAHDVDCDADNIRRAHAKHHNSNGLNKQMFR